MITFGHTLTFTPGKPLPVQLRNFYEPEAGYVWSNSKWCEIVFPFSVGTGKLPKAADLILDLDVFKVPPEFPSQAIMIYLNGVRIGQYNVTEQKTFLISIPVALLKAQENSLVIDTPESAKPLAWGVEDDRILGVQLFSAQIQPA
jgi:hypothetical protein